MKSVEQLWIGALVMLCACDPSPEDSVSRLTGGGEEREAAKQELFH